MDARQLKGFEIAKDKRLKCKGALWIVPSQSHAGHYLVDPREGSCTCPDHETRAVKCKHLWAVAYVRHEVVHPDGSVETTEVLRVTYTQDWTRYNAAQCGEKGTVPRERKSLPLIARPRPHTIRTSRADPRAGGKSEFWTPSINRRRSARLPSSPPAPPPRTP